MKAYSISMFGQMIADTVRMRAHSRALQRAITPDSVVLDIGAGTGMLSLFACRYGARKVYAIEPDTAILIAEQAARANGFADRMQCIQALSTEINLPEPANVVVSDLCGVLPLFEQRLPSIMDARRRLLAPGGKLIPERDILWATVVEAPELHDPLVKPWQTDAFEFKFDGALKVATNNLKRATVRPSQLLTAPFRWGEIDHYTAESPNVSAEINWEVQRPGTAHGLIVWFDSVLSDDITFSNAPGQPELIYGTAFFPWPSPVDLGPKDTLKVKLRADLINADYVWSWESHVFSAGTTTEKAHFQQSTYFGAPVSPASLRKRRNGYQPKLRDDGKIDLRILELMDGTRSNEEIAQVLEQHFPSRFHSRQDVLSRITNLAEKYSQ